MVSFSIKMYCRYNVMSFYYNVDVDVVTSKISSNCASYVRVTALVRRAPTCASSPTRAFCPGCRVHYITLHYVRCNHLAPSTRLQSTRRASARARGCRRGRRCQEEGQSGRTATSTQTHHSRPFEKRRVPGHQKQSTRKAQKVAIGGCF